jgi:hypothetical protein
VAIAGVAPRRHGRRRLQYESIHFATCARPDVSLRVRPNMEPAVTCIQAPDCIRRHGSSSLRSAHDIRSGWVRIGTYPAASKSNKEAVDVRWKEMMRRLDEDVPAVVDAKSES